jgi:P2 phage tail completion protein R (GpR).
MAGSLAERPMRKTNDLRAWLTSCVPILAAAPDKLQIYLDKGTICSRAGKSLSFEYRFTLTVLICDYPGDADEIVIPMLAWIEREQPDLLQRAEADAFQFQAEILDSNCADIEFSLEVTEPVLVTRRTDGSGFDVSHPAPQAFPGELVPGLDALMRQGYAWSDLLAETKDPAAVLIPGVPPEAGP